MLSKFDALVDKYVGNNDGALDHRDNVAARLLGKADDALLAGVDYVEDKIDDLVSAYQEGDGAFSREGVTALVQSVVYKAKAAALLAKSRTEASIDVTGDKKFNQDDVNKMLAEMQGHVNKITAHITLRSLISFLITLVSSLLGVLSGLGIYGLIS